jgi:hypothetical protein
MCRTGTAIFLTKEEHRALVSLLSNLEVHVNECPHETGYRGEDCLKAIKSRWNEGDLSAMLAVLEAALLA